VSRARVAVVVGVLVVFAAVGGAIILANQHHGGRNLTFNVTVTGARSMSVAPCWPATCTSDTLSATQNDNVTINIISDTTGEVHLHVYEIAFNAIAGRTVSHTFKAVNTCDCIIEWESTGTPLGALLVSP
jgi:hypothetical protein